jgi:hypothetical protein
LKRKQLGIYLILSLVLPILVTSVALHQQRRIVRKQVKRKIEAGIAKEELVVLTFTYEEIAAEVKWKHHKEFSYKNQMYDIVHRESNGNQVTYYCWWDHEENMLNKKLDQMLRLAIGQDPVSKNHQSKLSYFFKSLFSSQYSYPIAFYSINNPNNVIHNNVAWKDINILIQTPPPEFA